MSLAAPMVARARDRFMEPALVRVGYAPYIAAGPFFIAQAKGYFRTLKLHIEASSHVDGSLSLPALAAGELDVTGAPLSAGLFELVGHGAPVSLFMERGREAPGRGSNAIFVSSTLYERGFRDADGYRHAAGAAIAVSSRGSIAHYLHLRGLERAGLSAADVEWHWGMPPQVSVPLMREGRIGIVNLPVPGAYAAELEGAGRIAAWSDDIAPDAVLACGVANERFLSERHSALVRYCMAMMQGGREFLEAARTGDPATVRILAEGTRLPPQAIDAMRPRWTMPVADGLPDWEPILAQQAFWTRAGMLEREVPRERLFKLAAVKEAWQRYNENNPFL